jgi:hypothetical protein
MTAPNFGANPDFACRAPEDCSYALAKGYGTGDIGSTCVELYYSTKQVPEQECPVEFSLGKTTVMAAEGATND